MNGVGNDRARGPDHEEGVDDRPLVRPVGRDETVVEAVVLAVLAARRRSGGPPDEDPVGALDPLSSVLDPDALNSLARDRFDGRLEFDWSGCTVVVEGGSRVVVTQRR